MGHKRKPNPRIELKPADPILVNQVADFLVQNNREVVPEFGPIQTEDAQNYAEAMINSGLIVKEDEKE